MRNLDIRIEKKDSFKVIGMTLSVILSEEREKKLITALHDNFSERIHEIKNRIEPLKEYGIFIDPPNYNPISDPFTWIAGVEVEDISDPPKEMKSFEFPKQLYAITTYEGPKGEAGSIYDALYTWINQSDYEIAADYGLEIYSSVSDKLGPNDIHMDLYFPIKEKDLLIKD